jgi:hypothetical protein
VTVLHGRDRNAHRTEPIGARLGACTMSSLDAAIRPRHAPWAHPLDIISDVMWEVELEPEVEGWLDTISFKEFASVLPHIERLADRGSALRMPASRSLGEGLFELRFSISTESHGGSRSSSPGRGASCC